MTMTAAAMPSSEASSSPSKRAAGGLRGPRPLPLKVSSSSSSRGSSPPTTTSNKAPSTTTKKQPVIVYEHTPKVIHARPQEFMTVVQRLTGKPPATSSYVPSGSFSPATAEEGGSDPLLLTLGQRQAAPPATATTTLLPSPMAAGMRMSPGFIFSPNTMQAIQELSPLF
ncbi:VQ motif-containing protein 8, chloroplastic-like [Miscanthus floridulus]|uniref:VQ motif-containing protein 8, chloroplastic-like n=1 Tax=Miscanthus floridulus TaxID=154761 RepID=UPI00345852E6